MSRLTVGMLIVRYPIVIAVQLVRIKKYRLPELIVEASINLVYVVIVIWDLCCCIGGLGQYI